jgi:5-methylcytosine-specific restriction endonuclease McrA
MPAVRTFVGRFSETPLGRSHRPPRRNACAVYRPCLRRDFGSRCVYCGAHEVEVARGAKYGGFEIEHFRPTSVRKFQGLVAEYTNLMWSCRACNAAKGNEWPTLAEEKRGFKLLNPTRDSLSEHLRSEDTKVSALDALGQYYLDTLDLGSPLHEARRKRRADQLKVVVALEAILDAKGTELSPEQYAAIYRQVADVRMELHGPSRDTPTTCVCEVAVNLVGAGVKSHRARAGLMRRKKK